MPQAPLLINCSPMGGQPEPFFSPHYGDRIRWKFVDASKGGLWARVSRLPIPNPARILAGLEVAIRATWGRAALVVSHDPRVTLACEFFLKRFRYSGPHLAFTFNLPTLPVGKQLRLMRHVYRGVDRFLVYSNVERQLYHSVFDIPLDRISFQHWAVNPPDVPIEARPLIEGEYVCALGGNARDYKTLVEAARGLPNITFIIVARPENLAGFELPANVQLRTNIPLADAMNILAFSRLMALPLSGGDVPCGHVTLVSAMHLGKPMVVTKSTGISDYAIEGVTALTCEPFSPDSMRETVLRLWHDQELRERLSREGRLFAERFCSESAMFNWFTNYLTEKGLLAQGEMHVIG